MKKKKNLIITIGIIVVLVLTAAYVATVESGKGGEYKPSKEQVKSIW